MISFSRGLGKVLTGIAFSRTGSGVFFSRYLHSTRALKCEHSTKQPEENTTDSNVTHEDGGEVQEKRELTEKEKKLMKNDRSQKIPVETSIRYLKSDAYQQTYGQHFVWEQYRRNHKGMFPPRKTRKTCIRSNTISTGNPCPICRDEYLVLDHRNIELLKQFISPQSGQVLSYTKTGLCQKKHTALIVAVERAKDYGLITFDVPYREFDYSEFYENKDILMEGEEAVVTTHEFTFVVVGGGIAGVTCAETLAICCPEESILLITESNVIKTVANLEPVARYLYKFDVKEKSVVTSSQGQGFLTPAIVTYIDQLQHIEANNKYVLTKEKRKISYNYLCLCTGGTPHLIENNNSLILGIRDTDSVFELQKRLTTAKKIVLVGNGGIASELAHELSGVEVHWVVKDNHIASKFIDPGAAYFFEQKLNHQNAPSQSPTKAVIKRLRYDEIAPIESSNKKGAALGPDWHKHFDLKGSDSNRKKPVIHFKSFIQKLEKIEDTAKNHVSINVHLTSGETINCDFIVSATGVTPRLDFSCNPELQKSDEDNGIKVNEMMKTSNEFIYAAGDVCNSDWPKADHWFQMRLWTQARQMGSMAGRSMAAAFNQETIYQDFCFELFGHVTQLFGLPVILLGRFNGQGLGTDYEILIRTTPDHEYIKFVLHNGKLRGAILIGNTELAETCENLILNNIDLTPFGDDILNPDIDIEDYFD